MPSASEMPRPSWSAGIGQVVFCPLAQGVLTGKYKPGSALPADSRANDDRQNMFIKKLVENRGTLEKVQRLEPIARERKCTMAQLALAWILRKPEVTSCIIGATKPQQVKENAEASGIKLDEETIRRMEEMKRWHGIAYGHSGYKHVVTIVSHYFGAGGEKTAVASKP
jgi:aryl-alcohol dehydrogenase-like predicted oxidoreductase